MEKWMCIGSIGVAVIFFVAKPNMARFVIGVGMIVKRSGHGRANLRVRVRFSQLLTYEVGPPS